MTFAALIVRREFAFLLLAVFLGLGAATAYWISRASVLTIAVAPKDGTEPALIQAYADALARRHEEIRLKVIAFDDVRDSAAALQDGRADHVRCLAPSRHDPEYFRVDKDGIEGELRQSAHLSMVRK